MRRARTRRCRSAACAPATSWSSCGQATCASRARGAASSSTAALGLGLAAADVATLQRRTEGWAAGLQLAGLSLRGRRLAGEPAAVPAADDRLVVDYLVTEVLEGVDPALRRFLERTSILERLTAELCAAVTGEGVDACAERLAELDRRNLFTAALDAQGRWYRTHPLLSEALARHLEAADQSATLELHRRASRWWAAHGAWPRPSLTPSPPATASGPLSSWPPAGGRCSTGGG